MTRKDQTNYYHLNKRFVDDKSFKRVYDKEIEKKRLIENLLKMQNEFKRLEDISLDYNVMLQVIFNAKEEIGESIKKTEERLTILNQKNETKRKNNGQAN